MAFPYFVPGVINTDPVTAFPFGSYYSSPSYISDVEVSVYKGSDKVPLKTEKVSISRLPEINYYYPTSLYYTPDLITYQSPMYTTVSYQDINADKDLHKKMTKYFYSELYNRYIPQSYSRLLNYVKLTDKDIELVKSVSESKNVSTKDDEYGEKINYLADYIFSKKDIYNILWNYVEKRRINWWDLKYYSDDIENVLIKALVLII